MRDSKSSVSLGEYLDLHQLIEETQSSHEENRSFGLSHEKLLGKPLQLLSQWRVSRLHLLSQPLRSQSSIKLLSGVTLALLLIAFLLGILSGIGLLHYNGSEPVNLIYFLAMVLFLPILTMSFTLFAMLSANRSESMLIHLSPAYWMAELIALLPRHHQKYIAEIRINPLISNWLVIKRSQSLALLFSLGLFLALLGIVASKDIAFGWSTTLQVTPESFHAFASLIAMPWQGVLPSAVPSLELIEKSHYFRLGGKIDSTLVSHAMLLGEWWRFLAMTTLFYALFLRWILFMLASFGFAKAIERSLLSLEGVRKLLREMREPLVSTQASSHEEGVEPNKSHEVDSVSTLHRHYQNILGWALDEDTLRLQTEREGITADSYYSAGGLNSLREDSGIIDKISGNTLLYVKSWEPPTMDFVDFITDLNHKRDTTITLYLLGTAQNSYRATQSDFEIWRRKIGLIKESKIGIKR